MTDFFSSSKGSRGGSGGGGGQCNCACDAPPSLPGGITAEEVRLFLASGGDVAVMEMRARLQRKRKKKKRKRRKMSNDGFFDEDEDDAEDEEDDSEPITFLMEEEEDDDDEDDEMMQKKQKKRRKKKKRKKKKKIGKHSVEDEIDNEMEEEEDSSTTTESPATSEMMKLLKKLKEEKKPAQKPRGGKQLFGFEEELLEEVIKLTDEQIDTLPDDQKAAILELRKEIREAKALEALVAAEEEGDEVFDEAETIHFGTNPRPSENLSKKPTSSSSKKPPRKQHPEKHAGVGDTAEELEDMVHAGEGDHLRKVFVRYLVRLRTIYELDIQLIDQLGDLLAAFDDEILPVLETNLNLLRPLTNLILQSSGGNIDLAQLVSFIIKSLSNSEYELGFGASLKELEFLNFREYTFI